MALSKSEVAKKACEILDVVNGLPAGAKDISEWTEDALLEEAYKAARAIIALEWDITAALAILMLSGEYTQKKLNKVRFDGDRPAFPMNHYTYCAACFEDIMRGGVVDYTAPPAYHATAYRSGSGKGADLSRDERALILSQALTGNLTSDAMKGMINNLIGFRNAGHGDAVLALFDKIIAEKKEAVLENSEDE